MEYQENPVNSHSVTRIASKKLNNMAAGTKSLKKTNKSSLLNNASENHGDIIYNVATMDVNKDLQIAIQRQDDAAEIKFDETLNGERSNFSEDTDITSINTLLFNDKDDAAKLKLDEMMNNLLDILDETIDILKIADVDIGSRDTLSFNDEDDDDSCVHYRIIDQKDLDSVVNVTAETLNDAATNQLEISSEIQPKTNCFTVTITKNISEKLSQLNEFTESFIILLMLFGVYFLLSSLI